ncbi:2-hydroxyacyl-CoA dehydratase [Chloroflexota bacterium]
MQELLRLCSYTPDEIESESARIARAFKRWDISNDDIAKAETRIRRYFDTELIGVRKFLGIWLREFVDMTLAKDEGKAVIYLSFPPLGPLASGLADMADDVYCGIPETIILAVMGQMFGKLESVLKEAEKFWLPPGQANCELLAARLGAMLSGRIPEPTLLLPNGVVCDQVGKVDEIVTELYGVPVAHVDSGFSTESTYPPHSEERRVKYLATELQQAALSIKALTGYELDDSVLAAGRAKFRALRRIYYDIQDLLWADPVPMSTKDFGIIGLLISSYVKQAILRGADAGSTLVAELKQRISSGEGVLPKGSPRVLIVFPHMGDPAITEVIESAGLVIAASSRSVSADKEPLQYEGTWERAAELVLRKGGSVAAMVALMRDLAVEYKVDGVIVNTISQCRIYNLHPIKTKQVIEAELGIPVLALEHDPYDSREYTLEHFRSRVEPFAEVLRSRLAT